MGDGGQHTKAAKKAPEPLRYSPPRHPDSKSPPGKNGASPHTVPNGHHSNHGTPPRGSEHSTPTQLNGHHNGNHDNNNGHHQHHQAGTPPGHAAGTRSNHHSPARESPPHDRPHVPPPHRDTPDKHHVTSPDKHHAVSPDKHHATSPDKIHHPSPDKHHVSPEKQRSRRVSPEKHPTQHHSPDKQHRPAGHVSPHKSPPGHVSPHKSPPGHVSPHKSPPAGHVSPHKSPPGKALPDTHHTNGHHHDPAHHAANNNNHKSVHTTDAQTSPLIAKTPQRSYDDYDLYRRQHQQQQLENEHWPPRGDPKDYLIGGIYGPQPKNKPGESHAAPQGHRRNNGQLPHAAAGVGNARGEPLPYRSRSYPRENNARGDEALGPLRRSNGRSNHAAAKGGGGGNKGAGAAFSLIEAHEDEHARHRGEGMAHTDYDFVYPPLDSVDGSGSPTRNGKHRDTLNRRRGNTNNRKADAPLFDEAVITSDIINHDGLNRYKARLITFFKNGDALFPGVKISIKPGRDFNTFEALCNYLTPRTDLPAGVRYIFSMDGFKIRTLDEVEDGGHYVCSSRKKFVPLPYGRVRRDWKPHSKLSSSFNDEIKLFRPPSPGTAGMGGTGGVAGIVGGRGDVNRRSPDGQPGSREGRVIRVINNDDQTIQSRILLNLRTSQPWEEVLQDLGQALRLPGAKRLFTYAGLEVQSFSQLRNDFREVETFYLCTEHDVREPVPRGRGRSRNTTKSSSPPPPNYVDPIRVKIKGQRREVYPPLNQRYARDESPPDKSVELNWVYGYRGHDTRHNLTLLPTGELLYYVAAVTVLYDRLRNRQRHYTGHTEDIQCLSLHPSRELCATGQKEGKGRHSRAQIHIWDIDTLTTQNVIGINEVENGIISVSFSARNLGQHLLILDDSSEHMLSVWNWKAKRLIGKAPILRQKVLGGRFVPKDDMQIVTFGESHLTVWKRQKDGGFDRDDLLDDDAKTVTCIEFDEEGDQYLISGDTDGNISLWSDRTGAYQSVRVIQAHMRSVSAMLMLPDGTLLSSGGNEKDRYIKAWDSAHNYRAITFARLPESAGGVRSLCPSKLDSPDLGIFAGTSKNMVLEGSIHRRFKIVVQGHFKQLTALAVDPDEPAFVTAGYDRSISRWAMHKLVWKVQVQSECTSLAIHPMGEVVSVGTTDGHFIVLTLHRGMHVGTLPASKQVITCLAYSPDGTALAVALEEGSITMYTVSGRGYAYRRLRVLKGFDPLIHMDWSRDGKAIQSVTNEHNSVLWDLVTMEQEKIPSTMRDVKWHSITCTMAYSVNGIWNNVNQMQDSMNTTCCCSASEKILAVGDDEGFVRLYRYPCITPRADFHEIKAQSSKVSCVRFLYDDSFLITAGGEDAVLMQWIVVNAK